ncbi:MAG: DUF2147 domain-containing protein [Hyphomicrobiales bacterium]|nr:DUF2147 domain-containing protein [Hyphomicrobiales bacterium]
MWKTFCLAAALLAATIARANPNAPLGSWARGDGKAVVRIAPCGADLCATNTWIRPGTEDEKVGDYLVLKVKPTGEALAGEAYDPQRRLSFRFSMNVAARTMTTRGCMLAGLVCKTMNWTRRDGAQ